jgi:hypothetical protein
MEDLMKSKFFTFIFIAFILTACGFNGAVHMDQDKVINAASDIADFELPQAFKPEFSAGFEGYTMVSFKTGDSHSHLYLIQSENEADAEKLAAALNQIAPGSYDPQTRMTILETQTLTVREQEAALVLSEGVTSDGTIYRQASMAFQGKLGPALLIWSTPEKNWDQKNVDAFIASID